MHFPIADINLNPAIPFLIGLAVSALSSPAGISGGFLILPICVNYLNFTSVAVSPTNFIFNIVAMPSGLWRLASEKRMLWGLGALLTLGSLPGIMAGMVLRNTWLKETADFKLFVALVLAALALNLLRGMKGGARCDKAEQNFRNSQRGNKRLPAAALKAIYAKGQLTFHFGGEDFSVPVKSLLAISLLVGLAGGIYGIGGAAIIAPILISQFHLPVYVVNGASLLAGWATAVFGLAAYVFAWPAISGEAPVIPDFKLGLLFGLGGMAGVYLGSTAQRFLPPRFLKMLMFFMISIMAIESSGIF